MPNVAVKFALDGGDVDFHDDEMCALAEIPEQDIKVHKSQNRKSTMMVYNSQYNSWQLQIGEERYDTQSNLLQVINEKDEFTFYPHYQYNPATTYKAVLLPDEVKKTYTYGEREALLKINFSLLESSQ